MEKPGQSDLTLTLAPGSGQGLGKMVWDRVLADPTFFDEMADVARQCLRATTPRRWDKDTSTWISDPDYRVRMQTLFGLFAQAEGEPIKRIQHEFKKGGVDPLEALDSPAAVDAAERMIAGARAKLRRQGVKVGPKQVTEASLEVED